MRQSLQPVRLYTEAGEVLDWQAVLIKAQAAGQLLLAAAMRDSEGRQLKGFIVGQRLSAAEIEKARRQVKRSAYDKGHKPRAATLLACAWLTVLPTLAPTELNAALVLQLYRVRWQIELSCKRLKTILRVGQIRAGRGSRLARVHLLAKLIFALLLETIGGARFGNHWTQLATARRGTWFRGWKRRRDELTEASMGTLEWRDGQGRIMLTVLWERSRQRKLQRRAQPLLRWLQKIPVAGLAKPATQPVSTHLAA